MAASVCMVMLPVLIFPIKSLVTLVWFCMESGVQPDVFAFTKYALLWILPTVLLVMAIGLFLTVLTENYSGILIAGLLWLAGRPSIGKIAGGNYDLFDLIIRHNTLKGYGRMMENIRMLVLNRVAVSCMAFLLVALSVVVYEARRKGAGAGASVFKPVTNGIHPLLILSLCGAGAAILLFCKPAYQ